MREKKQKKMRRGLCSAADEMENEYSLCLCHFVFDFCLLKWKWMLIPEIRKIHLWACFSKPNHSFIYAVVTVRMKKWWYTWIGRWIINIRGFLRSFPDLSFLFLLFILIFRTFRCFSRVFTLFDTYLSTICFLEFPPITSILPLCLPFRFYLEFPPITLILPPVLGSFNVPPPDILLTCISYSSQISYLSSCFICFAVFPIHRVDAEHISFDLILYREQYQP